MDTHDNVCSICKCKTDEDVKTLTDKTCNYINNAAKKRLALLTNDSYKEVTMEINLSEMDLRNKFFYHSSCYKRYTAVKRKYDETMTTSSSPSLRK